MPSKLILTLAGNRLVSGFVTRYGMRLGARRFVAGEEWAEAARQVRLLNENGVIATMDYLGESVESVEMAQAARKNYLALLDNIPSAKVDANVSLKLTQMGLDLSPDICVENVRAIIERAKKYGNFVRIDMEDSAHTDATIQVFRRLRREFDNVGLVIQAYLYRSEKDMRDLADLKPNLRICKGAYLEKPNVAFPKKRDVDENYKKLVLLGFEVAGKTCIATHDEKIIAWAEEVIRDRKIPREKYEFQMLYGLRSGLQRELASRGHTVRVYVPYGKQWYPYFSRRLAERPANVFFVLSNLVKK